jgi:glycosyltransferase involved in cell wall biosynthesis
MKSIITPLSTMENSVCIAVIIPSYKVSMHILTVLSSIGNEVSRIYVVDDACPEFSGRLVETRCKDIRVKVIYHATNLGVGGAMITGYRAAIADKADIIVKIDGDGQMDPAYIPIFIKPILSGEADYTKGNRFFYLENIKVMPKIRLLGNALLSFITKLSTGYWNLFDPTNGYTAIHSNVANHLPFDKISLRYFFEIDMLFRLNTLNANVLDIPMDAHYAEERSNHKITKIIPEFLFKSIRNFVKRIFYNYYLRGLSIASIELPLGILLFLFGLIFGGYWWWHSIQTGVSTPVGTIMIAALSILIGLQLILAFLNYDIATTPTRAMQSKMRSARYSAMKRESP